MVFIIQVQGVELIQFHCQTSIFFSLRVASRSINLRAPRLFHHIYTYYFPPAQQPCKTSPPRLRQMKVINHLLILSLFRKHIRLISQIRVKIVSLPFTSTKIKTLHQPYLRRFLLWKTLKIYHHFSDSLSPKIHTKTMKYSWNYTEKKWENF